MKDVREEIDPDIAQAPEGRCFHEWELVTTVWGNRLVCQHCAALHKRWVVWDQPN